MINNLAMNVNIFPAIVIAYVMIGKSTFVKCHNTKTGNHVHIWATYSEFSAKKVLYLHILRGNKLYLVPSENKKHSNYHSLKFKKKISL